MLHNRIVFFFLLFKILTYFANCILNNPVGILSALFVLATFSTIRRGSGGAYSSCFILFRYLFGEVFHGMFRSIP